MTRSKNPKSNLFLLELMIVILFFAACTAVCVSLFAQASQRSALARELTDATLLAQRGAEYFKQGCEDEMFDDGAAHFDLSCRPADPDGAAYEVTISEYDKNGTEYADITVTADGESVLSVTAARYDGGDGR